MLGQNKFTVDEALNRCFTRSVAGQDLSDVYWREHKEVLNLFLALPKREGGLGFRQHGRNECFVANLAGMCAATLHNAKDDNRSAEQELHVSRDFISNLNNYNNAVETKDRLKGADSPGDLWQVAGKVVVEILQNRAAVANAVLGDGLWRRRMQALFSKDMSRPLQTGRVVKLRQLLPPELWLPIEHRKEQKGTDLWIDHPDWGSVLNYGIMGARRRTMSSAVFAYLVRRILPLPDPHGFAPTWGRVRTCGHVFGAGHVCTNEQDIRLRHSESRCGGTRGSWNHKRLEISLTRACNELLLGAIPRAFIPNESKHPDLTICHLLEWELLVDVTNVDSELEGSNSYKRMERKWKQKMNKYQAKCRANGLYFLPCVMSALGGFSAQTVQLLITPIAVVLAGKEGISLGKAKDRVMLRLQSEVLVQKAKNGMDFMNRQGLLLPDVVELPERCGLYGAQGIRY
jgi:hypothetical protein